MAVQISKTMAPNIPTTDFGSSFWAVNVRNRWHDTVKSGVQAVLRQLVCGRRTYIYLPLLTKLLENCYSQLLVEVLGTMACLIGVGPNLGRGDFRWSGSWCLSWHWPKGGKTEVLWNCCLTLHIGAHGPDCSCSSFVITLFKRWLIFI